MKYLPRITHNKQKKNLSNYVLWLTKCLLIPVSRATILQNLTYNSYLKKRLEGLSLLSIHLWREYAIDLGTIWLGGPGVQGRCPLHHTTGLPLVFNATDLTNQKFEFEITKISCFKVTDSDLRPKPSQEWLLVIFPSVFNVLRLLSCFCRKQIKL